MLKLLTPKEEKNNLSPHKTPKKIYLSPHNFFFLPEPPYMGVIRNLSQHAFMMLTFLT